MPFLGRSATSLLIGQPLARSALESPNNTGGIINPKSNPVGLPEVKLGRIAVQAAFITRRKTGHLSVLRHR